MKKWQLILALLSFTLAPTLVVANTETQAFPAKAAPDKQKTRWDVEWDFVSNFNKEVHLLRIVKAAFTYQSADGQTKTINVVRNLQLVEALAPYDDNITFYADLATKDRADKTVAAAEKLLGPPCVAMPAVVAWSGNKNYKIFREVHDDGIRWMKGHGNNVGYRGEKLVLASIFQAVNYVYIMEYNFTDDGRVVTRLGFTAHNYFRRGKGRGNVKDGDVHLHVGSWRMEFDLSEAKADGAGGPTKNDYRLISRRRVGNRFAVVDEPFGSEGGNAAKEGSALWKAEEFTTLRVHSTEVKNAHFRPVSYDLIPSRMGSVRDVRGYGDLAGMSKEQMEFVNSDFWLTVTNPQRTFFHTLVREAANKRELKNQPVTVWYSAPGIHVPRGEDFGPDGANQWQGVALTTWIDFTLRPRDLFDSTPLYGK
ncbi:MAG: hypothetical protein FJ303_04705 [Planctomycetes bacterium]|nr:hypothetical protein [Planctomycetota bacterium]